jgi:nucleoside-diphosphate kinase
MAIQRTFAMLKPGVLQRRLVGEILTRFEKKGLNLIGLKVMSISSDLASKHYAEHHDKAFYTDLVSYITSGPVVAMAIEGEEAIQLVRRICGPTKVTESMPGTIRGDFSMHTNTNIIHSSDSPAAAERELKLFFREEELVSWKDGNANWF